MTYNSLSQIYLTVLWPLMGRNCPQTFLKDCPLGYNLQGGWNKIFHFFLRPLIIFFQTCIVYQQDIRRQIGVYQRTPRVSPNWCLEQSRGPLNPTEVSQYSSGVLVSYPGIQLSLFQQWSCKFYSSCFYLRKTWNLKRHFLDRVLGIYEQKAEGNRWLGFC